MTSPRSARRSDQQFRWIISSSCNNGSCVAAAMNPEDDTVMVRDTKQSDGPILRFKADVWSDFVEKLKRA
ncbi:DUF397 domain-containing protein [Nonomuraea sp. NN258]|uniref:DUF397 domain-containing protein n=1 Tax=Nonomuraea antri TaxID=2730852 RepID=UPI00156A5F2B|nr:DUF397 domain-containing protein [Nonomuraea antri]NRQ31955.1 DUF397 domain-containing protein [Nonomuraea antri]